jgi:hypothetical protein
MLLDGWSAFWAVLLGVGFVVHMTFTWIGGEPTPGLHWRLQFFFVLLAGVAITGIALAGLTRMKKPKPKPRRPRVSPRLRHTTFSHGANP